MTTSYYPQEDWYAGDWIIEEEAVEYYPEKQPLPVDIILLAIVAVVIAALVLGLGRLAPRNPGQTITVPQSQERVQEQEVEEAPPVPVAPPIDTADPEAFIMPYTVYQLTQ
ncbi:MAG: hypothetical protein ACK2UP_06540, partial [Candidatus Promineifilaceae bacterium]